MKVIYLRCACCDEQAPAYKQWANQDLGYGCCSRCFVWICAKEGDVHTQWLYGKPGVHHSLPEWQETIDTRTSALTAEQRNK